MNIWATLKTVLFRDCGVSLVLKSSCIRLYTAVFRARLPCTHKKMLVFRGAHFSIFLLLIFFFGFGSFSTVVYSTTNDLFRVGIFSDAQPGGSFPEGWEPLTFDNIPKHTDYTLVRDGNSVVVQAKSQQSSSGFTRKISLDPKEFPIIQWRWKVENILEQGDVSSKDGDDYPARIYITFEYDSSKVGFFEKAKYETAKLLYGEYPPIGAINYIWGNKAPIGTIVPNPYTDRAQMIVTQSGSAKLHQWVTETHNVYEDYQKAFGEDPPNISGVAIMTDTDNTHESAIAYFGDIVFTKHQ